MFSTGVIGVFPLLMRILGNMSNRHHLLENSYIFDIKNRYNIQNQFHGIFSGIYPLFSIYNRKLFNLDISYFYIKNNIYMLHILAHKKIK